MKVLCIVDSINEIKNKINLLKTKFGDNISYIVRADFVDIFKTYGYLPNAIYYKNLSVIVQEYLGQEFKNSTDDVVVCYASLTINDSLLNKFISHIGNKTKLVNLVPQYNTFENMCNKAYNIYVKSLFGNKDSLASTKLQFIPKDLVESFISSHFGNRLFDFGNEITTNFSVENREVNSSSKTKTKSAINWIIAAIIALLLTAGLLISIAYFKVKFVSILVFVFLYLLDIVLTLIFLCKAKFDKRFLK